MRENEDEREDKRGMYREEETYSQRISLVNAGNLHAIK